MEDKYETLFQLVPWSELNIYQNTLNTHEVSLRCKIIHFWISTVAEQHQWRGKAEWEHSDWY